MNSLSEEISFHINQLDTLQVQFRLLQYLFSLFPPVPFLWGLYSHLYYICFFIFILHVDSWWFMLILVPLASSRILWGMVIRLKKYCSKVTSSLMRLWGYLQSIQYSFILHLFLHLYPTRGQLMVYADTCPISLL